jgi:hypothetical protein
VREDKRTMAEARTTMDSSSRVEAMAEARMTMVVSVVKNTTDRKDSKVDMVVVRIIMVVDSKVAMVVNVVRNITDRKDSKGVMVEDRIIMAEDSKTTALKVDAQEEETFLRAESKSLNPKAVAQKLTPKTSYGGGGGYGGGDDNDLSGAAHHAQQHAGDSGDSGMFSTVLSHLGQNKQNIANQPINEQGT